MASPYNLNVTHDCTECQMRSRDGFCNVSDAAAAELNEITQTMIQPRGAVLFVEGENARGIHILCSGKVKMTMLSSSGRTLIAGIAEAGEVLGVSATMLNRPYEITAETLEPCQIDFIRREDFLRYIQTHTEAAIRLARQLSNNCQTAHQQIRSLGLSENVPNKLARLLVDWSSREGARVANGVRLAVLMKHEEIAQRIGTTRETVTRTLSDFRKKNLIEVHGSTFILHDGLTAMAAI